MLRSIAFVTVLACAAAANLAAQRRTPPSATFRVVVDDPSGAAIPGAPVRLANEEGAERTGQTSDRGEATFTDLVPGAYRLHVEARGFDAADVPVKIRSGNNRRNVKLRIAAFAEQVTVTQSDADKRLADALTSVLTQEQIDQLPDDPEEMEEMLRQMAGPNAVLRVDGFRGGKLPPKSQIREIRFRMDPYAAENHDPGHPTVDIRTKPGMGTWRTGTNVGFRDESLNARNALAPFKAAEQTRRFGWTLEGPLARERTSFALSLDGSNAYEAKTIRAAQPDGVFSDVFRQPTDKLTISARVEHAVGKSHTLRGEVQRDTRDQRRLGVGDFDLLERAYSRTQRDTLFRLSDVGAIGRKTVNEFRVQVRSQHVESESRSDRTTVQVLSAFTAGGAQIAGGRRAKEIEIADNIDHAVGRHSLRGGILLEAGRYRSDERRNQNGTFTFSSLAAYDQSQPATFTQRIGNPLVEYSHTQFAWYVQDDIRLRKDLQVSAGLRHEMQTHLGDAVNFAPRATMTWSPFKHNKTTVRLGAGIFDEWYEAAIYEQTLRVDGRRQRDLVVSDPPYPDVLGTVSGQAAPPGRIQAAGNLVMPRVTRVSFGVEQQLPFGRMMVNIFDQHGREELRSRNINAPVNGVRPDPSSGNVSQIESGARSVSRGLNVGFNYGNPAKHFFVGIQYLLSSDTNEVNDPLSLPADSLHPGLDRGPARDDVRHRLFGILNTPLVGNLRLATMVRVQSGLPYTVTTGFDDNRDTVVNDRPAGVGRNSGRGPGQSNVDARLSWGRGFGRRKESPAGLGGARVVHVRDGDDALGSLPGGGDPNARVQFELYVQAYNVFNATNLINISGVQTSPFFGQASAALAARRLESGLRLNF